MSIRMYLNSLTHNRKNMISLAVRFLSMRSLTCKGVWLASTRGLLPYQLLQVFMITCNVELVYLIRRREARHRILLHHR